MLLMIAAALAVLAGGPTPTSGAAIAAVNPRTDRDDDVRIVPAPPTGLVVTSGCDGVALHWNDSSRIESGYRIYRQVADVDSSAVLVGDVGRNALTYVDASAAPGQSCEYRVHAYNESGESTAFAEGSGVAGGTPRPAGGVTCRTESQDTLRLEWSGAAGAKSFVVLERTATAGPDSPAPWIPVIEVAAGTASVDVPAPDEAAAEFAVVARNDCGDAEPSRPVTWTRR